MIEVKEATGDEIVGGGYANPGEHIVTMRGDGIVVSAAVSTKAQALALADLLETFSRQLPKQRLRFEVPGAPKPWERPGGSVRGKRRIPVGSRMYQSSVAYRANLAARNGRWRKTSGQVVAKVWIYFPDARKRDADNVAKNLQDGITKSGAIWEDDDQCLVQIQAIEIDRERPRVEIELAER